MLSLTKPSPMFESIKIPSSSGPRCFILCIIFRMVNWSAGLPSKSIMPQIPHIQAKVEAEDEDKGDVEVEAERV
jgi:hypothetical protein